MSIIVEGIIMCRNSILFILLFSFSLTYADWLKMNTHPNVYVWDILIHGDTVYTATSNGIYRTTNGGNNWSQRNNGLQNPQAIQCKQIIVAGPNMYTATVDGIYRSTNFSGTWIKKSDGIVIGGGAIYIFAESVYHSGGALVTGTHTGIYRSVNGGDSWTATNVTGSSIRTKGYAVHGGILFAAREVGSNVGSYRSGDNGASWAPFSIQGAGNLPTITFFSDGANLWAGTIDGVWLSTNGGTDWARKSLGLSPDPYSSSIIRVNGILLTSIKFGGSGMYRSLNEGEQWEEFKTGLPFLSSIEKLIVYDDEILAATSNGIYQRNAIEIIGILQISSEVPQKYTLRQNYPNPFNPVTNIVFEIPKASEVRLSVLDVTGRTVDIPFEGKLGAGTYRSDFDGTALASGVYFYRLETESFTETKKMMLVK
jgi:photosystem II stability/assembly factor-like uncharacterized protein